MAKTKIYNQQHPVALAVEPLRADAVKRAREYAERNIEKVRVALAEHKGDRQSLAPYPNHRGLSRSEYNTQLSYYYLVRELTISTRSGSRSHHDPDPAMMSTEGMAKYIVKAEEAAEQQYTDFIIKLIAKIGDCISATIEGSHVWSYSILTVQKGEATERWQTHMIINVSKLGLLFNQWPTRKIK